MKISVLKERDPLEKRVALVPDIAKKLIEKGHEVYIETKAGSASLFSDKTYEDIGAKISSLDQILDNSGILLSVNMPSEDILSDLKPHTNLVGLLSPYRNKDILKILAEKSINAFSMELVPRISRAQQIDALSSQSNLAGYRAIILASSLYSKSMSMMMTAAGTVAPAKVFIMGVGVAGLQAIATAKRLGAIVSATDVRRAAAEHCESLGASFIMVETDEDAEDDSGYAKEMSEEHLKEQRKLVAEHIKNQDIIVCSALVPGKKAPILISEQEALSLKAGSIIVDMAIEYGGNCELSKAGEIIEVNNIKIVGDLSLISGIAHDASNLYSRNLFSFLELLLDPENKDKICLDDEVVSTTSIVKDSKIREDFNN